MTTDSRSMPFDSKTIRDRTIRDKAVRDNAAQPNACDSSALAAVSYDECVERLAFAVDQKDDAELAHVARLIGQLAVVIEI